MSSPNTISSDKLIRLIGLPHCPRLLDVRLDDDFEAEPVLIPGSVRRSWQSVEAWSQAVGEDAVVHLPLRRQRSAMGLRPGCAITGWTPPSWKAGWRHGGRRVTRPFAATGCRLAINAGRTLWVTRSRPKIDRIACPWLVRRFVDPEAVFLFVAPAEVRAVAERFAATPFDIEDNILEPPRRELHLRYDG